MENAQVRWRKICCAVDFSDGAGLALELAAALARVHDADLVVLHSYSHPASRLADLYTVNASEAANIERRQHDTELERWRQRAEQLGAPRVQAAMMVGKPDQVIVDFAQREGVDLVVMGTHGRTGLKHVLMGSVAEHVVRRAPCPVLTTRAGAAQASHSAPG